VNAGPLSEQSDSGKWRDAICYTVEIIWVCHDYLFFVGWSGAAGFFLVFMIINNVAFDELAICPLDCYSIWVSKGDSVT